MCSRSFTQLVHDNQFSALGLALVAELANAWRVVRLDLEVKKALKDVEAEFVLGRSFAEPELLADIGEAVIRSTSAHPIPEIGESAAASSVASMTRRLEWSTGLSKTDLNNVESTSASVLDLAGVTARQASSNHTHSSSSSPPPPSPKKAAKKRRMHANTIDNLFHGLV